MTNIGASTYVSDKAADYSPGSTYEVGAESYIYYNSYYTTRSQNAQASVSSTLTIKPDAGEDPNAPVLVSVTIAESDQGSVTASVGGLSQSGQYVAHYGDTIPIQVSTSITASAPFTVDPGEAQGSVNISVQSAENSDIVPTSLQWDTTNGGADFSYQVSSGTVPTDTKAALYWSSSSQFADAIGGPIYSMDIPAGTTAGNYGPFDASASQLGAPPQGAKYLLVVTDPNNILGNFDPSQNVAALPLQNRLGFSNLSAPALTYGSATTSISGHLNSGSSQMVPAGESVSVTINGVKQTAILDNNDNFSVSFDTHELSVQGSPYTITFSYDGDSNFSSATGNSKLTVALAPLIVTVNDASKVQGDPNPSFAAGYQGFVNGEGSADLGGQLAFSTVATTTSPAGDYPIAASGLTSNNYIITYRPGTLTVTAATPAPVPPSATSPPAPTTTSANDARAKYQADLRQTQLDIVRFGVDLSVAIVVAFGEESGPLWAAAVLGKATQLGLNIDAIYFDIQKVLSDPNANNIAHLVVDAYGIIPKIVGATFLSLASDISALVIDAGTLIKDQQAIQSAQAG